MAIDSPNFETGGDGPAHSPPEIVNDSDRIAALEGELGEMRDRWMRSEAEIANVRARAKRDIDETRVYAVQKIRKPM